MEQQSLLCNAAANELNIDKKFNGGILAEWVAGILAQWVAGSAQWVAGLA